MMTSRTSVKSATALTGTRARELILVGGSVRESDGAIVGEHAVEFISRYKVDFAVIGASALDEDGAVLTTRGAFLAAWGPARQAGRTDPVEVLNAE